MGYKPASQLGKSFNTGNAVVSTLPVGSILEVSAQGQLTIVELPEPELDLTPGSRINTKYGPATVVQVTSRNNLKSAFEKYDVVYIADGTNTVRVAAADAVSAL